MDSNGDRYVFGYGVGDWDEDLIDSSCITNNKDVCHDCYETIIGLISKTEPKKVEVEVKKPVSRHRVKYDKDRIVELWRNGYSCKEIMAALGVEKHHVDYAVKKAKENGVQKIKKCDVEATMNKPGFKTTVDESGCVISIEEVP